MPSARSRAHHAPAVVAVLVTAVLLGGFASAPGPRSGGRGRRLGDHGARSSGHVARRLDHVLRPRIRPRRRDEPVRGPWTRHRRPVRGGYPRALLRGHDPGRGGPDDPDPGSGAAQFRCDGVEAARALLRAGPIGGSMGSTRSSRRTRASRSDRRSSPRRPAARSTGASGSSRRPEPCCEMRGRARSGSAASPRAPSPRWPPST